MLKKILQKKLEGTKMQKQIICEVLPVVPQSVLANSGTCVVSYFLSNIFKLKYPTCCYKNWIPISLLLGFWKTLRSFFLF